MKKDTERRQTIVRVLEVEATPICEQWFFDLTNKVEGQLLLNPAHLSHLLMAVKNFILPSDKDRLTSDKDRLSNAILEVKQSIYSSNATIGEETLNIQLESAFFYVLDSINTALRRHSIKPHWMFALDNLIREAISSAMTIISPQLAVTTASNVGLMGSGSNSKVPIIMTEDPDATPTPTYTSQRSIIERPYSANNNVNDLNVIRNNQRNMSLDFGSSDESHMWQERCKKMKAESEILWQEYYKSEQTVQNLLRSHVASNQLIANLLSTRMNSESNQFNTQLNSNYGNGNSINEASSSNHNNTSPPIVINSASPTPSVTSTGGYFVPNHHNINNNYSQHNSNQQQQQQVPLNTSGVNFTNVNCTNSPDFRVANLTNSPNPIVPIVVICQCCRQNSTQEQQQRPQQ